MNQFTKNLIKRIVPRPILNRMVLISYWLYDNLIHPRSPSVQASLMKLGVQNLEFFRRHTPESECFPFEVHYPHALENAPENPGRMHLVGENWVLHPEKPVAMCFGFNDWKFGFVESYLPQYRLIFSPRNYLGTSARLRLNKMRPRPEAIYVWGYTDKPWLKKWARQNNIPLIRVEDAFIRSAGLGAEHTTPYSLVFAHGDLHYTMSENNVLVNILNNHDFMAEPDFMENSRKAMDLLLRTRTSKYNRPALIDQRAFYRVKTRKRVLILGQVETDAAVRMANPNGWTSVDMVRLARLENPDAEIIYRPHPDTFAGYQISVFREFQVKGFADISSPDYPLPELLESVDQVYTITSLSGLEALLRGIKVTVLGTPFYSGWGLTDDRAKIDSKSRCRSLTIDELFAATYLLYPTYLADLDNTLVGFQSAVVRIAADRQSGMLRLLGQMQHDRPKDLTRIAKSDNWANLLLDPRFQTPEAKPLAEAAFAKVDVETAFQHNIGDHYHRFMAAAILGWLTTDDARNNFITKVRFSFEPAILANLLLELESMEPGSYLDAHIGWLIQRASVKGEASDFLTDRYSQLIRNQAKTRPESGDANDENETEEEDDLSRVAVAAAEVTDHEERTAYLRELTSISKDDADYDTAVNALQTLFLYGEVDAALMLHAADLARIRFDFKSCNQLARPLMGISEDLLLKSLAMVMNTPQRRPYAEFLADVSQFVRLRPSFLENVESLLQYFEEDHDPETVTRMLAKGVFLDNDITVHKAHGLLTVEETDKAVRTLRRMVETHPYVPSLSVAYCQALTFAKRFEEAEIVIDEALRLTPSSMVYREAMRVCVLMDKYEKGKRYLREAFDRRLNITDIMPRKISFGDRDPHQAFLYFRDINVTELIARHYPDAYTPEPELNEDGESLFVIPIFGPGDEVRFACLYDRLHEKMPHKTIRVGCEPRFESLFRRSFKNVEIVPVARNMRNKPYDVADYDKLPSSDLRTCLDNVGHRLVEESDDTCLATDLLATFLQDYSDFTGEAYLKADPKLSKAMRARLPANVPLIGLNWRSSLSGHRRNEHYVTIEQLAPVLALDGVQFVNLQYDDCTEELAWAEEHFPGKIINLEDIDQYNDFESVSALITACDAVVAPCTSVAELAGALGAETWLLSNSSEIHWRKHEGTLNDVWHNSLYHIEGAVLQDKDSLVETLRQHAVAYRESWHRKAGLDWTNPEPALRNVAE